MVIKVANAGAADLTTEMFAAAARRQLDALEIGGDAMLSIGKRRSLRMKQREIVGYEVLLEGLLADESIRVQGTVSRWKTPHGVRRVRGAEVNELMPALLAKKLIDNREPVTCLNAHERCV